MVHDERIIHDAVTLVERALIAAKNSNQAGENAVVAMAAHGEMRRALLVAESFMQSVIADGNLAQKYPGSAAADLETVRAAIAKATGKVVMA